MTWWKHFRMWLSNHWLKAFIGFFAVIILFFIFYGIKCFLSLESFYQQYMFAAMPLQIPMAMLHTFIFIFGYWYLMRNSMTKTAVAITPDKLNVSFSGVLGIDEAKMECMEVVELIRDHQRVRRIGGKIIKGILMLGPPGCGKTLLAKAIAKETKMPFLSMAGSEFTEMYVGVGASRVRKLFNSARKYAKLYGSCIVFIDEIDAIARGRQFSVGGGGQETNATQNQLLVEMDGLGKSTGANIIVIGATNAPVETMDQALLRPGRFDRKIVIDYPYAEGRNDIFKYYLGSVKHDPEIDTMRLANFTIGRSPADIENVVKESALICTREGRTLVEMRDITAALERISLGQERKRKIHPIELNRTAIHESGHAILCYYLHPINDVFKVSVATRGNTLGVMYDQPIVEMQDSDQTFFESEITVFLGGYAAEKITFGSTTSGCSSDFKWSMRKAYAMVYMVGMGETGLVGDFSQIEKYISGETKKILNEDVNKILQKCLKQAIDILTTERVLLKKMSEALVEKKTLEYDEVARLCEEFGVSEVRRIEERGLLQEFQEKVLEESNAKKQITASDDKEEQENNEPAPEE